MDNANTFKIGELSKFFNISVDSIRYYEKVGILNPIRNSENNYRFYTIEDFRRIALIRELLGLGFSTEQIKLFVNNRNVEKTKEMLNNELDAINVQISKLKLIKNNLINRLNSINDIMKRYNDEKINELNLEERSCIMVSNDRLPDNMVDYYLIQYMNEHESYVGTIGFCDCYTLDIANSNPDSNFYKTKNVFFYRDSFSKKECNYTLPAGKYLSIIYKNPLTKTKQLVPKLFEYAEANGYTVIGDPIEFCYIDEYETEIEEEYTIEIQLPVR